MATTSSSFGELLRRLRSAAALSQEGLAERAGISARGVSDLERGLRQRPRPETVRLLADVLAPEEPIRTAFLAAARATRPETARPRRSSSAAWPTFAGDFFGREDDLDAITELLVAEDAQLITITGTGGTGKTRFATEAARRVQDAFHDGVVFVDLAPITDVRLVMPMIARVTGHDEQAGDGSGESLTGRLRHEHRLIILDNCEQVLDAAVEIGLLLDRCPAVTVLATSRVLLGLRGEREWPLSPLPVANLQGLTPVDVLRHEPAVALFVTRAIAAAPAFQLTTMNREAVISICQQVDGLPLAIELAAARSRLLSAPELASRLHHRLPLLTGGPRNAPARQQTLRAAIRWSYDLLGHAEQAVLRQLAAFAGGWTLEAAESVIEVADNVSLLDVLGALRDHHLVTVDTRGSQTRFAMLETIHEFAQERLEDSGERDGVMDRHAAYFLNLAQHGAIALETPFQREWFERLDHEQPNLRQAFDHLDARGDHQRFAQLAIALWLYWNLRSNAAEGLPRLRKVLERETGETLLRSQALLGAGTLGYIIGTYEQAGQWLAEAAQLARAFNHPSTLLNILGMQGSIAEHLEDDDTAVERYLESVRIAEATGQRWNLCFAYPSLSDAAYRRGDLDHAEHYAREADAPIQETGNQYMECMNLGCLAQVWLARGDVPAAAQAFEQALVLAIEIGSHWNIANAIAGAAAVSAASGRYDEAALLLNAAEAACEATGHPRLPQFYLFAQTTVRVAGVLGPNGLSDLQAHGQTWDEPTAIEQARAILTAAPDFTTLSTATE